MLIDALLIFTPLACIYRGWSNYKAYKASDYLQSLIKAGAIQSKRDPILDEQYELSSSTTLQSSSSTISSSTSSSPPQSEPSEIDVSQPTLSEASVRADNAPDPTSSSSSPSEFSAAPSQNAPGSESDVLLHERTIPGLVAALGLPSETITELVHALRQVRTRLGLPPKPYSTVKVAPTASTTAEKNSS